eukprot:103035_1
MNKDLNICANNILVKSEVAYQMFMRSEPDILFNKLLTMLFRISSVDGCEIEIGDYGHSKNMATVWRQIYMDYIVANLKFVLNKPNSSHKIRFYSISLDGWSKGMSVCMYKIV